MKRYIKDRKTGLYKLGGAGWGEIGRAFNYGAADSHFDLKSTRSVRDRFRKCGADVVIVVLRRKPKVSAGERAYMQWLRVHDLRGVWAELSGLERRAWESIAKAATSS